MILFKKAGDLNESLSCKRANNQSIGFVPTMGALHEGHISLIKSSLAKNHITVSSIFVNPTQFNDPKDFEKYPITLEKDIQMLENAGCDVLFLPDLSQIYPNGLQPSTKYNLGFLEDVFDGQFRPGHYQGVCMVVERLLEIIRPNNLYLGQKDYQQCMVITRLIELMGKADEIKVNICPTLREADGLAMSSRNMRLSTEERKLAPAMYQALFFIKENLQMGNIDELAHKAMQQLEKKGFKPDYISVVDAENLTGVAEWDGQQKLVVLAAAFLNDVRLIDNLILN